jgi:adenine-specific DNA-methyltransferase
MSKTTGFNVDITEEQKDKLRELFPEIFSEGKIDWDKLKSTLGKEVDLGERYGLSWKGKSGVFAKIQEKTVATLHPKPEESVDWDTTQNMFIEGDNLEALKVLHKAYYGKIKMIYIDPPYNTGNDFVYNDDFKQARREHDIEAGITDQEGNVLRDDGLRLNTGGHKHSNWLNMMYPRLFLARNLLRQDGVIFVSIDDNEVHNLRQIMNEIFGEENFVAQFVWKSRQNKDNRNLTGVSVDHEYVLCYSRSQHRVVKGEARKEERYSNPDNDPRGPWSSGNMAGLLSEDLRPNAHFDLVNPASGVNYGRPKMGWRYDRNTMQRLIDEDRILWPDTPSGRPRRKVFLNELSETLPGFSSIIGEKVFTRNGTNDFEKLFDGRRYFDFPKPVNLVKQLLYQASSNNDIVLDFFSGSGTFAHAVEELNAEDDSSRQWITVQLPELTDEKFEAYKAGYKTIAEIARERIRRAGAKISKDFTNEIAKRETRLDLGFRSYTLGDSSFKKWNELVTDPDEIRQQTIDHLDPLEPGAKDEDLVTEILLKHGISPLTEINKQGDIYFVPSESLAISLSRNMTEEQFAQILAQKPSQIICLDTAFKNNINLKTNLSLQAQKQNIILEAL